MKFLIIAFSILFVTACHNESPPLTPSVSPTAEIVQVTTPASEVVNSLPISTTAASSPQVTNDSEQIVSVNAASAPASTSKTSSSKATATYKTVCLDSTDKASKVSTKCTSVRIHQKYEGTPVPSKK